MIMTKPNMPTLALNTIAPSASSTESQIEQRLNWLLKGEDVILELKDNLDALALAATRFGYDRLVVLGDITIGIPLEAKVTAESVAKKLGRAVLVGLSQSGINSHQVWLARELGNGEVLAGHETLVRYDCNQVAAIAVPDRLAGHYRESVSTVETLAGHEALLASVAEALPEHDVNTFEAGYRGAMESLLLALHGTVPNTVLKEAMQTALDAYGNSEPDWDDEPVQEAGA